MGSDKKDPQDYLPVAPIDFQILEALIARSRHGYEIMKLLEESMNTDVLPPKMYRHLRKLTDEGLIEIDEKAALPGTDPRRKYYKLTGLGRNVYIGEANRSRMVYENARELLGGLI